MELIIFIIIIVYIVKAAKKADDNQKRQGTMGRNYDGVTYQATRPATRQQSARVQVQQSQQEIQRQIERTKQRILESRGMQGSANDHFKQAEKHRQQENREAMQQVHAARVEARNTTILQRAKANADENAGVDAELLAYINEKIEARKAAKKAKNFAEADAIRDELLAKGITLLDTREGTKFTIN